YRKTTLPAMRAVAIHLRSRPSWTQHEALPATSFGDLDGARPSNNRAIIRIAHRSGKSRPAFRPGGTGAAYSAADSASAGSPASVAISASVRPEAFLRRWLW